MQISNVKELNTFKDPNDLFSKHFFEIKAAGLP